MTSAHPSHWLISTQVDADRKLAVPGAFADRVDDERSSRLYLALKRLVEAENLDAIAIRCWPELPRDYGQWPYLAVTRLADEGLSRPSVIASRHGKKTFPNFFVTLQTQHKAAQKQAHKKELCFFS